MIYKKPFDQYIGKWIRNDETNEKFFLIKIIKSDNIEAEVKSFFTSWQQFEVLSWKINHEYIRESFFKPSGEDKRNVIRKAFK